MPFLAGIVGRSGSGKTTLIEKLIPLLRSSYGLRISTVKQTHHSVETDAPGKDSWKHRNAGAETTLLLTPERFALHGDRGEDLGLKEIVRAFFKDQDLVLAEGFKNEEIFKIEADVMKSEKTPLYREPGFQIDGLVSDRTEGAPAGIPVFLPDDTDGICRFLVQQMEKKK